jgi:hypothetical protein
MDSFKRNQFKKEFPFLPNLGHNYQSCSRVSVRKADINVMQTIPTQFRLTDTLNNYCHGQHALLLDKTGKVLAEVRPELHHFLFSAVRHE